MTIEAKVIEDSTCGPRRRLTTFQLRYPRFIHAEFMTHRQFSRNASSSRAIPVEKQIEMMIEDTAMPVHWGKNQSGMQAREENDARIDVVEKENFHGACVDMVNSLNREEAWNYARDRAIEIAEGFASAGYHKQVVNRILEPFSHISVVCTSTHYDNFFALRRHPDAQPEIKVLADAMFAAMEASTPTELSLGEWHLPYVTDTEKACIAPSANGPRDSGPMSMDDLIAISVARCARVSYLTHDGKSPSIEKDLALYERLVGSVPLHASPAEHQATPDRVGGGLGGNLGDGWRQFRKLLPNECIGIYGGPNETQI